MAPEHPGCSIMPFDMQQLQIGKGADKHAACCPCLQLMIRGFLAATKAGAAAGGAQQVQQQAQQQQQQPAASAGSGGLGGGAASAGDAQQADADGENDTAGRQDEQAAGSVGTATQ